MQYKEQQIYKPFLAFIEPLCYLKLEINQILK